MELTRSTDMSGETLPITAVCIVADRNKCPVGFSAILRTQDEQADADLWRESAFSLWSRPVRYIAVSREVKTTTISSSRSVVTDLTVVKETEPVPHGYVAIDYTVDSREKALRKRFLCVKTEVLESCVDAVTDIIVLSKTKSTPKNHSKAGEIDGALVCFKTSVIPPTYGIRHTQSEKNLQPAADPRTRASSAYPQLPVSASSSPHSSSFPSMMPVPQGGVDAFTIKGAVPSPAKGIEGIKLVLHPKLARIKGGNQCTGLPELPDISSTLAGDFNYGFQLERATLSN